MAQRMKVAVSPSASERAEEAETAASEPSMPMTSCPNEEKKIESRPLPQPSSMTRWGRSSSPATNVANCEGRGRRVVARAA